MSRGDRETVPGSVTRPYSARAYSWSGSPRSPRVGDNGAKKAVRSPRAWAGTDWSCTTCSSAPRPSRPSASSRSRVRASGASEACRRWAAVVGGAQGSSASLSQPTAEVAPPENAERFAARAKAPSERRAFARSTAAGSSGSAQVAAAGSFALAKWCSSRVLGAVSSATPSLIHPSASSSQTSPSIQRACVDGGALAPGHAPGPPRGAAPEASCTRRSATVSMRRSCGSRSSGCRRMAENTPRVRPL